jgi:hypothetical protein
MADGKDRQRLLQQFDDDLHAPLGGAGVDVDARLNAEFARTE